MKSYCKIIGFLFCLLLFRVCAMQSNHGLDGHVENVINATKNARNHSNMGNISFSEGNYISALKEYEIAYNLTSGTTASSTYLYNIARCYMKMEMYNLAKKALLGAIQKDCMNITYYQALCDCYIKLGVAQEEIVNYTQKTENPYNKIVVGLLYLKLGKKDIAKTVFDNFINENPKMLITSDVRAILQKL